jgi:hypothetical protein
MIAVTSAGISMKGWSARMKPSEAIPPAIGITMPAARVAAEHGSPGCRLRERRAIILAPICRPTPDLEEEEHHHPLEDGFGHVAAARHRRKHHAPIREARVGFRACATGAPAWSSAPDPCPRHVSPRARGP